MPDEARIFHFQSKAVPDDTFQVAGMRGREEISQPYEFQLDLVSRKVDVAPDKMLTNNAFISIRQSIPVSGGKRGTRLFKIHGIVSEFEVLEKVQDWVKYRAVLVPRLWKSTLTTQSRVFQEKDIKDLIKDVLTDKEGPGLTAQDFDVSKLSASYQKREFVVQYNETDLDFLHRWMEHEGVFYFFDQTESGEKLIFCDGTAGYAKLPGDPKIPYRPDPTSRSRAAGAENEETLQEESVHSFRLRMRKTPKTVMLKDYNYRTPSVEVKAKADVDNPAAEGKFYMYGEHFKTATEGTALAKLRAEEIQCRDKVFDGTGDHRSFRPGTVFTLSEHYRADFNAGYVLTRVSHSLGQATGAGGAGANSKYAIEFDCIPSSDVFRPERRTPWPSIYGFLNAKVDAGGDGKYAEIDDQGRYKIKLPFDMSDKKDGKASRFMRMAQPYAGADMGMHFPLHKNTEVLLSFVDGDVDRPIIASAVPNTETAPPVTSGNQSQCAIHTGGGNKLVIEDTAGNERIKLSTPHSKTVFQLGSPNSPGTGAVLTTDARVTITSAEDWIRTTGGESRNEVTKDSYNITKGNTYNSTKGNTESFTDGNSTTVTKGNSVTRTEGNAESVTIGNSKTNVTGNTDDTFMGDKTAKSLSKETSFTAGVKASFSASAESEVKASAMATACLAVQVESNNGLFTEISKGGKITLCEATELTKTTDKDEIVSGPYKITCVDFTLDSSGALSIEGGTKILLKCGGSEILLEAGGIKIKGTKIEFDASGALDAKAGGQLTAKGASIKLDGPVMES